MNRLTRGIGIKKTTPGFQKLALTNSDGGLSDY